MEELVSVLKVGHSKEVGFKLEQFNAKVNYTFNSIQSSNISLIVISVWPFVYDQRNIIEEKTIIRLFVSNCS